MTTRDPRWARIASYHASRRAYDIHDLRYGDQTRPGSVSSTVDKRQHRRDACERWAAPTSAAAATVDGDR